MCDVIQTNIGTVVVCHRGRKARQRCSHPGCGLWAEYLCDHPILPEAERTGNPDHDTCSRPICAVHRQWVGYGEKRRDYCEEHAKEGKSNAS